MESVKSLTPAVVSTHISYLFFVGDRVYKVKRPVSFPFLDLSTASKRLDDCEREVRLNRRLAPDVYLGVGRFTGPDLDEPVVVMRRLPADRKLSRLADTAAAPEAVRAVAHRLAAFHTTAESSVAIDEGGSQRAIRERWLANVSETHRFVGGPLTAKRHGTIRDLALRYVEGRDALFSSRIAQGRIRDAHGDLLADDIFCLDDGPRILDCLEFDDRLRHIDVIEDCASLATDLERLGRPDLADRFVADYKEFTNDRPPPSLFHHYAAYRALVRAKVACLREEQGDPAARDEARLLFSLSENHLARAAVHLVMVGGLPGTGKTTIAETLAEEQGWAVVSSDRIRKELTGVPLQAAERGYRAGIYESRITAATYEEMLRRADRILSMGGSVILDASWGDRKLRTRARRLAARTSSDLSELRCSVPLQQAIARIASRSTDPTNLSDATTEVARKMAAAFAPWPEAITIDTTRPLGTSSDLALAIAAGRIHLEPEVERVGAALE
jgi:hypothetical protein